MINVFYHVCLQQVALLSVIDTYSIQYLYTYCKWYSVADCDCDQGHIFLIFLTIILFTHLLISDKVNFIRFLDFQQLNSQKHLPMLQPRATKNFSHTLTCVLLWLSQVQIPEMQEERLSQLYSQQQANLILIFQ